MLIRRRRLRDGDRLDVVRTVGKERQDG
jgi:hypothetical protein